MHVSVPIDILTQDSEGIKRATKHTREMRFVSISFLFHAQHLSALFVAEQLDSNLLRCINTFTLS